MLKLIALSLMIGTFCTFWLFEMRLNHRKIWTGLLINCISLQETVWNGRVKIFSVSDRCQARASCDICLDRLSNDSCAEGILCNTKKGHVNITSVEISVHVWFLQKHLQQTQIRSHVWLNVSYDSWFLCPPAPCVCSRPPNLPTLQ